MDEPENVVKLKEFLGKDLWNQMQDFQKRNKKFEERQELAKKIGDKDSFGTHRYC